MSAEMKNKHYATTALVLAICSFVLGLIPIIGWLLVITATVFLVLSYSNHEKGPKNVVSLILVSLTWVGKILFASIFFFTVFSPPSEEESGIEVETVGTMESADSNKEEEKDKVYKVGDVVQMNDKELTVIKVEKSNGNEYSNLKSGDEYVIVSVKITNNSKKEISYNPYDFEMSNSKGQIFQQSFSSIHEDTALHYGELVPGGTVEGTVVFEQPKDDEKLQLQYTVNFWRDRMIRVDLQ
ncbi:DUF4352 domain-containing protein [Pseudalkalibacillus hwajinpoensis]|uniref:DUF4352 domain-containing protein n=1 Tax=Guptibacillus hwajinpoensis TaxID=208199 RepID=UPI001CFCFBD9|nr:DUF4352 domain-containing protein [Pseudalkalibacillus hwajinpoensis]